MKIQEKKDGDIWFTEKSCNICISVFPPKRILNRNNTDEKWKLFIMFGSKISKCKCKIIKLLVENIGENLHKLGQDKCSYTCHQKHNLLKTKILIKFHFIQIYVFCSMTTLLRKWRDILLTGRKYWQSSPPIILATWYEGPVQNKKCEVSCSKARKKKCHLVY